MERYVLLGVVVAALALFWYLRRPDVTSSQARQLVADGARLIDVRSPAEFTAGHLDGASNIPVGEIARRTGELQPTDRPIVLYCASGTRSAMAARTLRSAGHSKVFNLGPMSNW